jgi:type III pantothenate kinase
MTFLAIDVGNTRLKWALYQNPHPKAALLAQGAEFLENIDKLADGAWATLAPPAYMMGCIVAGDALKRRVQEQLGNLGGGAALGGFRVAEAGLTNGYDYPSRLGADRWVAMIGAWHRSLAQGPGAPDGGGDGGHRRHGRGD